MKKTIAMMMAAAFFGLTSQAALASDIDAGKLFKGKCKMCHSIDKKKTGPALKDMNTDPAVLKSALTTNRVRMMKGVNKKLNEADVDALVAFILSKQPAENNPCAK
ncbi:MAG: c-type cytochrome [Mariprofundus sp.]